MSYNHTYAQIKEILKSNPKITKDAMLQIASLAIVETMGSEMPEGTEIKWDSKLGDDLELDSLAMVELVMFLEECFGIEIPDEEAGNIVTVGDACSTIKKLRCVSHDSCVSHDAIAAFLQTHADARKRCLWKLCHRC